MQTQQNEAIAGGQRETYAAPALVKEQKLAEVTGQPVGSGVQQTPP